MKIKHLERLKSCDYFGQQVLPCVIRVMKSAPSNRLVAMHDHEFSEIVIVVSGRLTHLHAGGSTRLQAGDFFVIHPGSRHGYAEVAPHTIVYNILFSRERRLFTSLPGGTAMLRAAYSEASGTNRPDVLGRLTPSERMCSQRLMDEIRRCERLPNGGLGFHFCQALFSAVLLLLSRRMRETDAQPPKAKADFARAEAYVNANLANSISVHAICTLLGISPSSLHRLFKQKVGMGPGQFVLETRLAQAELLLSTTDLNLSAIAERTGFNDASHLSRAFKAKRGQSPGSARKEDRR